MLKQTLNEKNESLDSLSELNIEIVNSVVVKTVFSESINEIPINIVGINLEAYENKAFVADEATKTGETLNSKENELVVRASTIEDFNKLDVYTNDDTAKCKNVFFFGKFCSLFQKNNGNQKQIIVRF